VRHGQAVVVEYHLGEWQVASDLLLVGQDFVGGYLTGVDPDVRSRVDVLLMLVRAAVDVERERRLPVVSMLRGEEEYKLRLRPQRVVSRRMFIGRNSSVVMAGYAAAVRGCRAAQALLHDRMPRLRLALLSVFRVLVLLRSRRGLPHPCSDRM